MVFFFISVKLAEEQSCKSKQFYILSNKSDGYDENHYYYISSILRTSPKMC